MKIILSSQDFWFGPVTQMFSFIKHLVDSWFDGELHIKNTKNSKIFYNNFIKYNDVKNIKLVDSYNIVYDKYIGFYDPEVIFKGKKENKKTIFLCNLTFLWNSNLIIKDSYDIKNIDFSNITNHHNLVILWYLLSDRVFIRNTDSIDKSSYLYKNIKNKLTLIWPIIYPKLYDRKIKDFCLIQFGGQINPISNFEFYKTYFKVVKKLVWKITMKKIIIVHPKLESLAKTIFHNEKIITTLSKDDYQRLLSQSKALFSPFGINTLFESSYYSVPTFILPEQHLWHIKSIIKYDRSLNNIQKQSFLLYSTNKYNLEYEDEKEFINFLLNEYKKILNDKIDDHIIENFLDTWKNLIKLMGLEQEINKKIDLIINEVI